MPVDRLSPLDASFLAVEGPSSHMHVGWVALFSAPRDGAGLPSFAELRAHIAGRLDRAPRYRQRLEAVPLGVHQPVWADDSDFDLDHHVRHSSARDLDGLVDAVMSAPLPRDRPLWQFWIADQVGDGQLALVGKAHHCMVDGLAAVELASLLLDDKPERGPLGPSRRFERHQPEPPPEPLDLLTDSVLDRLGEQARAALASLRALADPFALGRGAGRFARSLARAALPPARPSLLNGSSSPLRHLARSSRALDDLRAIKSAVGTTVNDVVLAACAGALRSYLIERGEVAAPLKTMVPVSVRAPGEQLGNRISFMFVELPIQESDPLVRLLQIHRDTASRKRAGEPADANAAVQAIGYAPRTVQRLVSQALASRRMFNLVISNIPGPPVPLYMRGCRLEAAWPIVPLADGHSLSIGMTTVRDTAHFGLYVDPQALPDADDLALRLDGAVDELLAEV